MRLSLGVSSVARHKALCLLLFVVHSLLEVPCVNGVDTSEHPGKGPLGVTLDYSLAILDASGNPPATKPPPQFLTKVFTSHLTFEEPVSAFKDGQLFQLAMDGAAEMLKNINEYELRAKDKPLVMTVLAYDKEIILASSQKGSLSFTYDYGDSPVREELRRCIASQNHGPDDGAEVRHKNRAQCGEQMVAHMFYLIHPHGNSAGARVISVTRPKDGTQDGKQDGKPSEYIDPCPTDSKGPGCDQFVTHMKWNLIPANVEAESYKLDEVAGKVTRKQPSLCGRRPA